MKIKANNANSPIWKDVYSHSKLPQQLEPLNEIATNLWWVWNHEALNYLARSTNNFGNPQKVTLYSYCKAFHTNVWKRS